MEKIKGLLIDCGAVSKKTKGVPYLLSFELSAPPNNKVLYVG